MPIKSANAGMQETWVQSLGQEDPLEEDMATHSVVLPGKFHGQRHVVATIPGVAKSQTQLSNYAHVHAYTHTSYTEKEGCV